jgi:hypothetical protein
VAVQLSCRSRVSLRSTRATRKEIRKRNAGRRSVSCPARKRRAGRATDQIGLRRPVRCQARSPAGVPPRFSPEGVFVPKAQLQARLPGTWPERLVLYSRPNRGAETSRLSTGVTRAEKTCPSPAMHLARRSWCRQADARSRPGAEVMKPARGHRTRPCRPASPDGVLVDEI